MSIRNIHCKNLKQFFSEDIKASEVGAHEVQSAKKLAFMVYAAQKNPKQSEQFIYMVTDILNVKNFAEIKGISARVKNGQREINRFSYVFKDSNVQKFGNVSANANTTPNWVRYQQRLQEQKEQTK